MDVSCHGKLCVTMDYMSDQLQKKRCIVDLIVS